MFFSNPFEVHAGSSVREPTGFAVLYPSEPFLAGCSAVDRRDGILTIETDVLSRRRETTASVELPPGARTPT